MSENKLVLAEPEHLEIVERDHDDIMNEIHALLEKRLGTKVVYVMIIPGSTAARLLTDMPLASANALLGIMSTSRKQLVPKSGRA